MNKTFQLGNITADPVYNAGNTPEQARVNFSIAVSRRYKREGQPDSDFFNCVAFGGLANVIHEHFKKGSRIMVMGRLQNDNYTNKNGEKVYSVGIIVEEIGFCEKKGQQDPVKAAQDNGFMNIPDGVEEDLPFC